MGWFNPKLPHVRYVSNNVVYDTQKAEHIASYRAETRDYRRPPEPSSGWGDPGVWQSTYLNQHLYLSKAGNWFLVVNDSLGRNRIQPLTYDQAFHWLRCLQEVDVLERFFSERLSNG